MFIPKAVCRKDGREMIISKTALLVEMIASWGSYYKVYGDEYTCPDCENAVILPAEMAMTAHFEPAYAQVKASVTAKFADNTTNQERLDG